MRILGIDFGSRRHGLAVSDALGLTAQPIGALQRSDPAADLEKLQSIIDEKQVRRIVIGLPRNMDGSEAVHFKDAEAFAAGLEKQFGLPVDLWEERLTTAEAERILLAADTSRKKRKKAVDTMAATLILQSWMDCHPTEVAQARGMA